jgi:class 3 adenylate cyclase/tetratricopeptide (TPR) repeat protein
MKCLECGHAVLETDAFCGACGSKIASQGTALKPVAKVTSEGERRPLTVMFCDLVDSTRFASELEPEDFMDALHMYQEMISTIVQSFEGYVAQYLGDGLLVYFGYPLAHEDDPERAVYAALGMLNQVDALNVRLKTELEGFENQELQIRIGIHSGLAVVSDIGSGERTERLATGDTVNVAARLESEAPPNHAVVSDTTQRLSNKHFEFSCLGERELKGIPTPMNVFKLEGMAREPSAKNEQSGEDLGPMVGRLDQLASLESSWQEITTSQGHSVMLYGEAGVGKSRMIEAFQQRIHGSTSSTLVIQASSLHQRSALYPITKFISRRLGVTDLDTTSQKIFKIRNGMADSNYTNEAAPSLFTELLELEAQPTQISDISQAEKRVDTFRALTDWVLAIAGSTPLLLVVEDLHWLDPSTLEWLGECIERTKNSPVLILMTARTSFETPWPSDEIQTIKLDRLQDSDQAALIRTTAGEQTLPEKLVARLVEKSGGVPLFAQELTRSVLENIDPGQDLQLIETIDVPETLIASLTARLDRLGPAKELAQIASILGREFSKDLIASVAPVEGIELAQALDILVKNKILYRQADVKGVKYIFYHALLQDTAYQSILRKRCRQHHGTVAEVLCNQFPDTILQHPELIAHHYDEAGNAEKSIEHYSLAGKRATDQYAHQESVSHYSRALELLLNQPESTQRNHIEIGIQTGLALSLSILSAFSDKEVGQRYKRAYELCRASPDSELHFFETVYGLSRHHQVASELNEAVALGEELLSHSQATNNMDERLAAHSTLAQNLYWQGKFHQSLEHANAVIDEESTGKNETLWRLLGTDPGVSACVFAGFSLWALGYPDKALKILLEGISLAQKLKSRHSEAYATGFTSVLCIMLRDPELAKSMSSRALQISDNPRLPIFWGQGLVVKGWARVAGDGDPAGIEDAQNGMDVLSSVNSGVGAPGFMSTLAETHARLGNYEPALAISGMGIAVAAEKGQPQWVADLLTVHGLAQMKLAIALKDANATAAGLEEAESSLRKAVSTAEDQDAKSLKLRAWNALATCLMHRGSDERMLEARDGLASIYSFFESQSGPEQEEARLLIEKLTASLGN